MRFLTEVDELDALTMEGFFVGWPHPPTGETLRLLLRQSSYRVIACEGNRVVGYATGLSDGVLFAYLSSLEVLPEYQGQGLGKDLVFRLLDAMPQVYAVDLICDPEVQPFYEKCGFSSYTGALIRRRERLQR